MEVGVLPGIAVVVPGAGAAFGLSARDPALQLELPVGLAVGVARRAWAQVDVACTWRDPGGAGGFERRTGLSFVLAVDRVELVARAAAGAASEVSLGVRLRVGRR